ncbi:peptide chain release factor 1 [bacterium]|nr:peptide chain release factor 1 [bacterium]
MIARLEEILIRFERLTGELSNPAVINNREQYQKLSKEHSSLEHTTSVYREFKADLENYEQSRVMQDDLSDKEMAELAAEEVKALEPKLELAAEDLRKLLLPKDPNDEKNVLLEVRAGVGGDEAGLFVNDLFRAYQRYADSNRWKVELMSLTENSAGGLKEVIALIEGDGVYSKLKYESGVHRVQRVPKTEASGRIHTSTVTVAVLPEAEDVEIDINPNELRIDVFRAQGAGGQHVNTTDSAVRITHLPTGEVVQCQDERSQLKNKAKAMKVLKSRLLEKAQQDLKNAQTEDRRSQVGAGFRNERIRTYNFPQGRVTDHRIGLTSHNIDDVMTGEFSAFITALNDHYQAEQMKEEGSEF